MFRYYYTCVHTTCITALTFAASTTRVWHFARACCCCTSSLCLPLFARLLLSCRCKCSVHVRPAAELGDAARAVCSSARCQLQLVHRIYVTRPFLVIRLDMNNCIRVTQQALIKALLACTLQSRHSKYGGIATHIQNLGPEWRCEAPIVFPLQPFGARWVGVWVGHIGRGT